MTGRRLPPFALGCVGAAALLVAAYSNSFHSAFHFDDSHVLVNNAYVRSVRNIPRFFTDARTFSSHPPNATYRPLVSVSLAVDYWLAGGLSPAVFHVSQLVLLALLGAALVGFYRGAMERCLPGPWNRYLALFGATLFCVHTVNTETMNLMHARSEIVSALGIVLGFLVYWRWPRLHWTFLYLLPVAVGALAKTPALMFAPLLFAWVFLETLHGSSADDPRPATIGIALRRATGAAAPAFGVGVLLYWLIEGVMKPPTVVYGGGDRVRYALTQAWVWLEYLRLFVLPIGLTADTDMTLLTRWYDTRILAGIAVIALLGVIAWRCARSRAAWPVAFGLAWFALGLAPTSSILPLFEPMNEHRVFLPYIGLVLALVWGARVWLAPPLARWNASADVKWATAAGASVVLLLGHAVGTHARNEVWRSGESLWADVTRKSPQNGRAWMNYGLALMEQGKYPAAKTCFDRALTLTPAYGVLEVNVAILNGAMGDQAAAEAHFRRALQLDPRAPTSHYFYARWLIEHARAPEAIGHLEEAARLSPADEQTRDLLLDLRAAQGDEQVVRRLADEYLALLPENARARAYRAGRSPMGAESADYDSLFQTGVTLGKQRNFVQSALAYRAALRIKPASADALNNHGWTLGNLGFYQEAIPYLEQAVRLRPDFELARNNAAWARSRIH